MKEKFVYEWLEKAQILYKKYEHPAAYTMEECRRLPFLDPTVTMCKNLVLCNRQQTAFYLLVMLPEKPFHTGKVSKALGSSRLSFAPDTVLPELLGVRSGAVSPLGLLLDKERRVRLICDGELKKASRIAFHPLVNTATVIFDGEVFWQQVLPAMGVMPCFIDCD